MSKISNRNKATTVPIPSTKPVRSKKKTSTSSSSSKDTFGHQQGNPSLPKPSKSAPTTSTKTQPAHESQLTSSLSKVGIFRANKAKDPLNKALNNKDIFNADFYLNKYPLLRKAGIKTEGQARTHFIDHGIKEGRQASPLFDASEYRSRYADVDAHAKLKNPKNPNMQALLHFDQSGIKEGKVGATPSTKPAVLNKALDNKKIFDADWYLNNNSDLRKAGVKTESQARAHFTNYGIKEGRQASPFFNASEYRSRYADIDAHAKKTDTNNPNAAAIAHFNDFGIHRGRGGTADALTLLNPNVTIQNPDATPFMPTTVDKKQGPANLDVKQWHSKEPFRKSDQTSHIDPVYGKADFAMINGSKRFAVLKDENNHPVYDLAGTGGVHNPAGGANLFIQHDLTPKERRSVTEKTSIRLKAKLSNISAKGTPPANVAQSFVGTVFKAKDPKAVPNTMFVQFVFDDARGQKYLGSEGDVIYAASNPEVGGAGVFNITTGEKRLSSHGGKMQELDLNLHKGLERALTREYKYEDYNGQKHTTVYPKALQDPSQWELESVYMGIETQGNAQANLQVSDVVINP